ncbi:MAG: glycosyltransferase family 4 protein [Patescibacteria group bacterium]
MTKLLYFTTNLSNDFSSGQDILNLQYLLLLKNFFDVILINFFTENQFEMDFGIEVQNIKINLNVWEDFDYPENLSFENKDLEYVFFTSPFQANYLSQFSNTKKIYLVNNQRYQKSKNTGLNIGNQEQELCMKSDTNLFLTNNDFIYFKNIGLVRKSDLIITPFILNRNQSDNRIENTCLISTNLESDYNKESLKWFLDEVLPNINPEIKITICGKGDFEKIKTKYPNIQFVGFLKRNELEKLYQQTKMYINPTIHGSGIQVKSLEALSYGMQLVSTSYSNIFPNVIPSSDDPLQLANIINSNINSNSRFNFENFNKVNIEKFLSIFGKTL